MKLEEIRKTMTKSPTVMDINDELLVIAKLMDTDIDEIINNKTLFFQIIDDLELTHVDSGFMQLTEENEKVFIKFCDWLIALQHNYNLNVSSNTVESFSLTAADVEKLMPRS